jgi:hypothetical protein
MNEFEALLGFGRKSRQHLIHRKVRGPVHVLTFSNQFCSDITTPTYIADSDRILRRSLMSTCMSEIVCMTALMNEHFFSRIWRFIYLVSSLLVSQNQYHFINSILPYSLIIVEQFNLIWCRLISWILDVH